MSEPDPLVDEFVAALQNALDAFDMSGWDKFIKTHGRHCLLMPEFIEIVFKFLCSVNAKNRERNQRLAHLEATAERLQPLERRVREMEEKHVAGVQWAGIHKADTPYDEGQLVTHGGGLWISTRATEGRPGGENSGWTLVVKQGSYGTRTQGLT
jgi:hypothetical protein